jgi:integrase
MNGLKRKTPGCCGNHLSVQRGERPFSPWAKSAPSMASRSTWIPCPRRRLLSREEVARLIDAALTPYHRTLLMTLYAAGVRRAELTHLKVSDIDSKRMVIHVQRPQARTWAVPSSATLQRDRGTPKRWGSSQAMDLTCTTRCVGTNPRSVDQVMQQRPYRQAQSFLDCRQWLCASRTTSRPKASD